VSIEKAARQQRCADSFEVDGARVFVKLRNASLGVIVRPKSCLLELHRRIRPPTRFRAEALSEKF
jgi:hypothetical protein